jgi:peroxiredoxin Q/BCP
LRFGASTLDTTRILIRLGAIEVESNGENGSARSGWTPRSAALSAVNSRSGRIAMAARQVVRVGDPAPDFQLLSATGESVALSDFRGKAEVVLFFYPKDNTPICSAEACSFRDQYDEFREAGAEVIGISTDSVASHQQFAGRHQLPFQLLSDTDGSVRVLYGVPKTLGALPGRVTYVIDRHGIVRHLFSSQFQPAKHVAEALGVLRRLRETEPQSGTVASPPPHTADEA